MVNAFLIYLLQSSICLIAFYAFYHWILRKENFFQLNRFYLIASIGLSFLLPYLQVNYMVESNFVSGIPWDGVISAEKNSIKNPQVTFIDPITIIFGIYLIGFSLSLLKLIGNIAYLFKLYFKNQVEKKENFYLIKTAHAHPVFSFFKFIFWSKELNYDQEESQQILLHELVHIQQRHTIDVLFMEIATILFWFNPFMYLYKRGLKDTHEYIADEHLYTKHQYQIRYVELLIKEAKKQKQDSLALVHTFFNNQLKQRLTMIKNNNKQSSKLKFLGCLPIIAILFFSFSMHAQETNSSSSEMPEIEILEALVKLEELKELSKLETLKDIKGIESNKDVRVIFAKKIGKVMVGKKGENTITDLKYFNASLTIPDGKNNNGIQMYQTITQNVTGSSLDQKTIDLIHNIKAEEIDLAKFTVSDIVTVNGEKIPGQFKLSLE